MSITNLIRHDLFAPITSLSTATIGTLSTDVMLQRLAWTLAIIVSALTIIRYTYRCYKWIKNGKIELKHYEDDDD